MQFQAYVRQRIQQMNERMPKAPSSREAAELAFLEQEVIDDHMPARRRKLRDPLKDTSLEDITYTNLPLLCRFISEGGAILPRKLTGVGARKQKFLSKAIKRAQQLALLPPTWKLPRYRHASYMDEFSQPERPPQRIEGDEFADPPDIRFPGVQEARKLDIDLGKFARDQALRDDPRGG